MKKLLALAFLVSAAGLGTAGYKNVRPVFVSSTSNYATGSLGTARDSADTSQMIGCYVYANEAYDYQSMTCSARDATGRTAVCHSENPHLIAVAGRMNGDSYIQFAFNMPAAQCLTVRVDNYSYDVPKL